MQDTKELKVIAQAVEQSLSTLQPNHDLTRIKQRFDDISCTAYNVAGKLQRHRASRQEESHERFVSCDHATNERNSTYIMQQRESNCRVHTFSFGGKLIRNNLNFYQQGEHCDSTLNGVTIIEKKQHVDYSTLLHHQSPNCESHQDYKGIFDDSAVGVFNGKVIVDKIAQKIDAFQQNNNILISDKATINAKPQLEIFAVYIVYMGNSCHMQNG